MSSLLSYSLDTQSENLVTNPCWLSVMAGAPSVQMPRRYFKSNPKRMQAFLTVINMSYRQEKKSSFKAWKKDNERRLTIAWSH